jgi:hypothetical protein
VKLQLKQDLIADGLAPSPFT